MTDQLALVEVAVPDRGPKPLSVNQQRAHDYLADHPAGVTVDEIGAYIHTFRDRNPHGVDVRCDWCAKAGRSVVTSKGLGPLVTFRRVPQGNLYRLRTAVERDQAAEPMPEPTEAELAANPFAGL